MGRIFQAHPALSYRADLVGTVVFVVVAAVGMAWHDVRAVQVLYVVVSLALFAIGVVAALWGYARSLERSRTHEVGVAQVYLLSGTTAPPPVKRDLLVALTVQVAMAFAAAIVGVVVIPTSSLNVLAFGALVPMLGIGLNGAWAASHGTFGPRQPARATRPNHRKID